MSRYPDGYSRVTEIIGETDPELQRLKHTMSYVLDVAATRGTKAHDLAELKATGKLTDIHLMAAEQNYLESLLAYQLYERWYEEHVTEVIAVERTLTDDKMMIGGTCDLIARLKDGRIALCDLKTGSKVQPSHAWQTAAYVMMAINSGIIEYACPRICVYCNHRRKNPKAVEHGIDMYERDLDLFLCCYKLHRARFVQTGRTGRSAG